MKTSRIIFHIDMNCFFASCEIAENEELKNKPIVVAHDDPLRRGLILSPSYEARKFGIYTTMKVRDAIKLCKEIIVVEPDYSLYSHYSHSFYNYFLSLTNKVEMASIDEAYIDVTDCLGEKSAIDLANEIQQTLLKKLKLPCSIGIAPNKFLAKMASDMKKPLGITILRKREIDKYMWPLPIENMFGVGKKSAPKLRLMGINTIGDLVKFPNLSLLKKTIGEQWTNSLLRCANGIDDSPVVWQKSDDYSSVSSATTFDTNVYDEKKLKENLKILCGTIGYRLESSNHEAKNIGLSIKYEDFHTFNRSHGLDTPISSSSIIYDIVEEIFDDNIIAGQGVRYLCVYAQRVTYRKENNLQISMFDNMSEIEKDNEVRKLLASVNNKYGSEVIKKGYYSYNNLDDKSKTS